MTRQSGFGRAGLVLAGRVMSRLGPGQTLAQSGRINGQPQDDRYRALGGREVPPKHMRQPHQPGGGGGGSSKSSGCALVLIGLASAPWLADLLLVAS